MAKILLADDEPVLLGLLAGMLEYAGHEVVAVSNGNALLDTCSSAFDLVITDLIMPEKEGIETIIELRRGFPKLKIVAMSGGGRGDAHGYLRLAEKLGAAAILEKPFERDELIALVNKVLAK